MMVHQDAKDFNKDYFADYHYLIDEVTLKYEYILVLKRCNLSVPHNNTLKYPSLHEDFIKSIYLAFFSRTRIFENI